MARHALIMAGGSGTRFWPLSRHSRPKQFLRFFGNQSLLRLTVERARPVIGEAGSVLIIANAEHLPLVHKEFAAAEKIQVAGEPVGRNTAACVGLAAVLLARQDPAAIIAALPADHSVMGLEAFRRALDLAFQHAQETGAIVTLGITPTRAETGYGYIALGEELARTPSGAVHRVAAFKEKPDHATAQAYLADGRHLWNAGIFVFPVGEMDAEIARQMPALHRGLVALGEGLARGENLDALLHEIYPGLPNQSIDKGVAEKARNMAVVPLDAGWSDVGCWEALREVWPVDKRGNVTSGPHVLVDSHETTAYSDGPLIAAVGAHDLIIVATGDVVLVCPREEAQRVREIVAALIGDKDQYR